MNNFNDSILLELVRTSPIGICILDAATLVIEINNEPYLAVAGKTAEQTIGHYFWDVFPEVEQMFAGDMARALDGESVRGQEIAVPLIRFGKLEDIVISFEYSPVKNEAGEVIKIAVWVLEYTQEVKHRREIEVINRELSAANEELIAANEELGTTNEELSETQEELRRSNTELEQRSIELAESEERFRTMAEGTDVMIAVGDETGKAVYFNKVWEKATGRSMDELMQNGWIDLMHPEDRERVTKVFLDALAIQAPWTWEFRMPDQQGGYRWLLARGIPRFREDGSFAGYISSSVDITERRQDEQRKNDFISMVSHELKTPVTSLKGYLQLLQGRAKKAEDTFTYTILDKAANQVNKMTGMINGFLNMSRLESGKIHIDKQRFDMADLIKEAEEESLATITTHHVIFAPVEPTPVTADRNKIGQVVTNLISNAVKYSPAGSTVHVACITVNDLAMVSVMDEGMGIAPDDAEKLFDRYYRVESQQTKSIAGFGIGLYLCKEIIDHHQGTIAVKSEIGKGSTFYFTLPVDNVHP